MKMIVRTAILRLAKLGALLSGVLEIFEVKSQGSRLLGLYTCASTRVHTVDQQFADESHCLWPRKTCREVL